MWNPQENTISISLNHFPQVEESEPVITSSFAALDVCIFFWIALFLVLFLARLSGKDMIAQFFARPEKMQTALGTWIVFGKTSSFRTF